MTQRPIRIAIVAVAVVFLIATAFVSGVRYGRLRTKVGELIVYSRRAEAVEMQYRVADPLAAESALRGFLGLCDDLLAADNELLSRSELAADRTLTLARLHRIRTTLHDAQGASTYLELAVGSCAGAGWRDCTPAGILAQLDASESQAARPASNRLTPPSLQGER